jgi:hypothetical protein
MADVSLPGFPNYPCAIATATLDSQCTLHLLELTLILILTRSVPSGALQITNSYRSRSQVELSYDRRSVGQSFLVSRSHLEPMTRCLFSVWQLRLSWCGTPSLTRGWVCNLLIQLFLCLARAVTLGSKSRRTHDHFYCLILDSPNMEGQVPVFIYPRNRVAQLYPRALGSLFVASYDSQGYGGGILKRLHTGQLLLVLKSKSVARSVQFARGLRSRSLSFKFLKPIAIVWLEGLGTLKNKSNDLIGNRTRDLLACYRMSQDFVNNCQNVKMLTYEMSVNFLKWNKEEWCSK